MFHQFLLCLRCWQTLFAAAVDYGWRLFISDLGCDTDRYMLQSCQYYAGFASSYLHVLLCVSSGCRLPAVRIPFPQSCQWLAGSIHNQPLACRIGSLPMHLHLHYGISLDCHGNASCLFNSLRVQLAFFRHR